MTKFVMVTPSFRHFAFDAKNQDDANKKAFSWARHQGFDVREVWAELAQGDELNWKSQNAWVS